MLIRTRQFTGWRWLWALAAAILQAADSGAAEAADPAIEAAAKSFNFGRREEAFGILDRAIAAQPVNSQLHFARGRLYEASGQSAKAVADFDEVIRLDPRAAAAYQIRAQERLKLGRVDEAVSDFNKLVDLVPRLEPQLWQRGVALYLTGQYVEGRRQFESHRKVNPNDVEVAAWHFLCVARLEGVEKARAALFPVEGDARVPMKEIQALFAGRAAAEAVLAAAKAGDPEPEQLVRQLFHAHLYLGLYYEATGERGKVLEHLQLAAGKYQETDFMGAVAKVHLARLGRTATPKAAPR